MNNPVPDRAGLFQELVLKAHDDALVSCLVRHGGSSTVVVVPGVMADAQSWLPVAQALPSQYSVVVMNRRGRYPSTVIEEDHVLDLEIEDLAGVLDALTGWGLPYPVHLVGWSYGGLLCLEEAARRDDISSMTLYEPVVGPFGTHVLDPLLRARADGRFDDIVEIINRDLTGLTQSDVDQLRKSPAWPVLVELGRPAPLELSALNAYAPAFDKYPDLRLPAVVIVGEESVEAEPYWPPVVRLVRSMPASTKLVTLDGQGHLAHVNDPDALARAITTALTQMSAP